MYANGVLSGSDQSLRIRPGLGPDQLTSILEGLAKLTPLAATNFQRLLQDEARRFPWGSTIIIVTALMTEPLARMIEELLNGRNHIILLCIGAIDVPSLPGLIVHTLSDDLIGQEFDERSRYVRMIDVRG
jgi:hypothetical protein